ncbi:MAG: respiratory nitrate reductase subunit beta, partial [Planctomycetota bacterium]
MPASKPPTHQFAMVFDLNKCLGCQTCTIACKTQWTRTTGSGA